MKVQEFIIRYRLDSATSAMNDYWKDNNNLLFVIDTTATVACTIIGLQREQSMDDNLLFVDDLIYTWTMNERLNRLILQWFVDVLAKPERIV